MFRLLALKVLDDCAACAHKVLQEGTLYSFCQDYEEIEDNPFTLKQMTKRSETTEHLYDVVSQVNGTEEAVTSKHINLSINAIVGKNGDGKSSIVELLLRVINNFACCFGYLSDQQTLAYNISVSAILYYELEGSVYAINCPKGDSYKADDGVNLRVQLYKNGNLVSRGITSKTPDEERKKWLKDNHADELFYAMVVNYSIYAYNSRLFGLENREQNLSWIDALFHKNDSYQTPVVLNPMRTAGNIDINQEEMLSHQRLMSLYTSAGGSSLERMVNDGKEAVGFAFTLESESKLLTKTIGEYFGTNYNMDIPWPEMERFNNARTGTINQYDEDALDNVCNHFLDFWESAMLFLTPESQYYKILANLNEHGAWERREGKPSDLHDYIKTMCDWMEKRGNQRYKAGINKQLHWFLVNKLEWINYTQFYRLMLIRVVWEYLKEICPEMNCEFDDVVDNRRNPKYAARLYVCYKIIEILNTYTPYYKRGYIEANDYNLLCNPIDKDLGFKLMKDDIKTILSTDDYTTLKLRQTLNYIKYTGDDYYNAKDDVVEDAKCKFLTFEELKGIIEKEPQYDGARNIVQLLPPPIFNGHIVIKADGERFFMTSMSSGEMQMVNTTGSLLYHLRNLDDKLKAENKINYKNILVILEEVELYFHPEYQKKYVKYLRDQIVNLNLQNIDNINIVFVTHSPFILTDILQMNSLYLEKGEPQQCEDESFAGNLYDLMHSSFFLRENAMGNFAADYVTKLVERKNAGDILPDNETEIIGDTILRSYLQS